MVDREIEPANGREHAEDAMGRKPQGILETVVYCECLSEARDFYEQVVGLTVVSVEPGRHVFFRVGQGMLLIFNPRETESGTVLIGDQMIPQHGSAGPSHFAFEILPRQVDAVREHLESRKIAIEAEIKWPMGGHSIYCRDPAGNSVEFATRELWFER
jgi:catechol 2,3-dioxygenase-like lactoylglutathione lyase family enzyme